MVCSHPFGVPGLLRVTPCVLLYHLYTDVITQTVSPLF
jgi:hypothetical protein